MKRVPKPEILMDELLNLYQDLVIPFMKIRRDVYFPTETERNETDGEHAYTLSMLAITLAERMHLSLDSGLIAKYALVHDLVEVHAGDVSARADEAAHARKAQKEHEAYLLIKEQYLEHAPWIAATIEAYEKRADEESKFVYATDKIMGAFSWIAGNGDHWASNYPDKNGNDYHKVVALLRKKAQIYPPLLELFDTVHKRLDELRPQYYEKSKHEDFIKP